MRGYLLPTFASVWLSLKSYNGREEDRECRTDSFRPKDRHVDETHPPKSLRNVLGQRSLRVSRRNGDASAAKRGVQALLARAMGKEEAARQPHISIYIIRAQVV